MKEALILWLAVIIGILFASLVGMVYDGLPLAGGMLFLIAVAPIDAAKAAIAYLLGLMVFRRDQSLRFVGWSGLGIGIVSVALQDLARSTSAEHLVTEAELAILVGGGMLAATFGGRFSFACSDGADVPLVRVVGSFLLALLFIAPLAILLPFGLLIYLIENSARPLHLAFGTMVLGAAMASLVSGLLLLSKYAAHGSLGLRAAPRSLWVLCNIGVGLTVLGALAWLLNASGCGLIRPFHLLKSNVVGIAPLSVYGFLYWRYLSGATRD